MDEILPLYKPIGITSFDMIRRVKRLLPRGQKIGHAGTLDPFASGVLLLLLGKATKRFAEIQGWEKTYRATARLGSKSDTLDRDGKITEITAKNKFSISQIQKEADKFVGEIEQVIPAYSAAKYKGKALYKYARRGEEIPQKSKKVTINSITIEKINENYASFLVECGSGTYIRQLSYDIFKSLGVESYLQSLTRLKVGQVTVEECLKLEEIVDREELLRRLYGGESQVDL